MAIIQNPILRGFNPDPSICQAGDNFYIATSTFEWFPGVQIHHSKDLVNWRLLTHPLSRVSQLDMRGLKSSAGIWAPCLTYNEDTFYLIYTVVRGVGFPWCETPNYLVTAHAIDGPWSEPVFLNSSGFDPSFFHDTDGKKYLLNMLLDFRGGEHSPFAGIVCQEYSEKQQQCIGSVKNIFKGSELGFTEGPHLYKKHGYYYLMTAEGGTGYEHAISMARSKSIWGDYEIDPMNPFLSSFGQDHLQIQKAGHGSFVELADGFNYVAHLCGRPQGSEKYCNLGRETSLQKVVWSEDAWLRIEGGGSTPKDEVEGPNLPEVKWEISPERYDFKKGDKLDVHFQSMRVPVKASWLRYKDGCLILEGRDSPLSDYEQSLIARRLQSFNADAETLLKFSPESFMQMAGLSVIYNTNLFIYCCLSFLEGVGPCVQILQNDNGKITHLDNCLPVVGESVRLRVQIREREMQFFAQCEGGEVFKVGPQFDAALLCDERAQGGFTGTYIGMACHDKTGQGAQAYFSEFRYSEY